MNKMKLNILFFIIASLLALGQVAMTTADPYDWAFDGKNTTDYALEVSYNELAIYNPEGSSPGRYYMEIFSDNRVDDDGRKIIIEFGLKGYFKRTYWDGTRYQTSYFFSHDRENINSLFTMSQQKTAVDTDDDKVSTGYTYGGGLTYTTPKSSKGTLTGTVSGSKSHTLQYSATSFNVDAGSGTMSTSFGTFAKFGQITVEKGSDNLVMNAVTGLVMSNSIADSLMQDDITYYDTVKFLYLHIYVKARFYEKNFLGSMQLKTTYELILGDGSAPTEDFVGIGIGYGCYSSDSEVGGSNCPAS